jgi:uncharacterized membrane protein required for colicin V production
MNNMQSLLVGGLIAILVIAITLIVLVSIMSLKPKNKFLQKCTLIVFIGLASPYIIYMASASKRKRISMKKTILSMFKGYLILAAIYFIIGGAIGILINSLIR